MTDTPEPAAPSPLAFATATGFVFQIVGLILALGGCCLWSLSGKFESPQSAPVDDVTAYVQDQGAQLNTVSMVGLDMDRLSVSNDHSCLPVFWFSL